ncbi:hypothetical protein WN943_005889 [Citrus x changshan-huyou]
MLSFLQELCGNCECSSIVFTSPRTSNQTLTEAMVNKFSNQDTPQKFLDDEISDMNSAHCLPVAFIPQVTVKTGRRNIMSAELEHVNAHLENGCGSQCQSLQPKVININE